MKRVLLLLSFMFACSSYDELREQYPFEYVRLEKVKEGRPEHAGPLFVEPTRVAIDGGTRWQLRHQESLGALSLFVTSHLQAAFLEQGYTVIESLAPDLVLSELVRQSHRAYEESDNLGRLLGRKTLVLSTLTFRWDKETGSGLHFELEGLGIETGKRVLYTSDPFFGECAPSLLALLAGLSPNSKRHNNLILVTSDQARPRHAGEIAVVPPRAFYGFSASEGRVVEDWTSERLLDVGYSLVDRAHVDEVFDQQREAISRLQESEGRIKLGRLLGADALLFTYVGGGNVGVLEDERAEDPSLKFYSQRLVRVRDGKILAAASGASFAHQPFRLEPLSAVELFVASMKLGEAPTIDPHASEDELREIASRWDDRANGYGD